MDRFRRLRLVSFRAAHEDLDAPRRLVDRNAERAIFESRLRTLGVERLQLDAGTARVSRGGRCERFRADTNGLVELAAGGDTVDQLPLHGALAFDAFDERRENVGTIAAHHALVHEPREPTRTRQNGEKRRFR